VLRGVVGQGTVDVCIGCGRVEPVSHAASVGIGVVCVLVRPLHDEHLSWAYSHGRVTSSRIGRARIKAVKESRTGSLANHHARAEGALSSWTRRATRTGGPNGQRRGVS
jgi:hypothetical protein